MTVDELIQLMRLSGTDKVRDYLDHQKKLANKGCWPAHVFLHELKTMFKKCKRDSITEAWPTLTENETSKCTPPTSPAPAVEDSASSTTAQ